MGNTTGKPSSDVLGVHCLALVEEIKPDFESFFSELNNLMDCRMEEPMDFGRTQTVLKKCKELLSRVRVKIKRHRDELNSSDPLVELEKKTKLERDQKVGSITHRKLSEMITELAPKIIEYMEREKRIQRTLEQDLSRNTALTLEARKVPWWWKLVPFGFIPTTFIIQSKLVKLRSERMWIQALINQTRADSIIIYKHMENLVVEKKSNELQMLSRAVELHAQTEKMNEMSEEVCLIAMEGFRQFRDINHCALIFDFGMDIAYWHSSKDVVKKQNISFHTKSLLNFLDSPKFPHLLQILVNRKLLEEVNQKALHLRDFLIRSLDHASLLSL